MTARRIRQRGADGPGAGGPPEQDRLPLIHAALRTAAARHGTPLYLTDETAIAVAADELRAAFPDPWIRQYSVKANDVPAVIAAVTAEGRGLGANVVSRGEWAAARAAGVPNARLTLEGIGKTDADLRAAVRSAADGDPIRWLAIESADEAAVLDRIAARARLGPGAPGGRGRRAAPSLDILFRLNPDVTPETHASLAVGAGGSKFGMTETELSAAVEKVVRSGGGLRARGIHLHVGSQLGAVDAWRDAVRRGLALLALLRGSLEDFDTLDVGGGFPVAPRGEAGPRPERFARELPALLDTIPPDRRPGRLAIEPGRFLVARAGWLVGRVLHVRDRDGRQVVLDTGMTELIRPALYGGRHAIIALTSLGRPVATWPTGGDETVDVHGPICESTDALGVHRLPALRRGDLVAIRDAGAYAASLSSGYNGRPRPPQVLLRPDGSIVLARRRGSLR
ncbi:MAG TPA: diaminopimelate decarboxylase [Candidatus Limnocylindrales bacterium]|nr:diaminopimelate decarboxylase [Candidatus Limnocylindrales bacterium]